MLASACGIQHLKDQASRAAMQTWGALLFAPLLVAWQLLLTVRC